MESRITQIEKATGDGSLTALKELFSSKYSQLEINIALENAIAYSQIEVADYLLTLGARFSHNGYQGVYYAVHNDEIEGLKYVIQKGVDINVNNGMLLNAAVVTYLNTKDIHMIKWMIANRADTNHLSKSSIDLIERCGTDELCAALGYERGIHR